jgi:hypothetical protein
MNTEGTTAEHWRSAWPDALAFAAGLAMAWRGKWTSGDLVWSLWLASLVVGYATILWTIFRPVIAIVRGAWRDRALRVQLSPQATVLPAVAGVLVLLVGGLFVLTFFTVHFGMFHFVHSQFLAGFFPIDTGRSVERGMVGLSTYAEVARRYWWFLPSAFLAERSAFLRESPAAVEAGVVTFAPTLGRKAADKNAFGSGMMAPYRNVVRMHLLIFFFAFAYFARLDSFAVYAVVYAVYFFPWRLMRRRVAEPTLVLPGS